MERDGVSGTPPPSMGEEFYESLDRFLTKPAPNLLLGANKSNTVSSRKEHIKVSQPFAQRRSLQTGTGASSIEEAFAYSKQMADDLREASLTPRPLKESKSRSAPALPPSAHKTFNGGGSSVKGRKVSVVSKLRSKVSRPLEAFVVNAKVDVDSKKNPVDFDGLLRNFETGATLLALRAELEQSKQSLASSEDFIRSISRELKVQR